VPHPGRHPRRRHRRRHHRDTLAAAVSPIGGILAQTATRADATGHRELLAFAGIHVASDRTRRCWAVEFKLLERYDQPGVEIIRAA